MQFILFTNFQQFSKHEGANRFSFFVRIVEVLEENNPVNYLEIPTTCH
jgi:hypothetical protein